MSLKKILALVLVLAMCASLFPASAFADNGVEPENEQITEPVEETQPEAEPADNTPAEETEEGNEPAPVEGEGEEPASEEEEIVVEEEVDETEIVVDEAVDATVIASIGDQVYINSLSEAITAAGNSGVGTAISLNTSVTEDLAIAKLVSITGNGTQTITGKVTIDENADASFKALTIAGSVTVGGGKLTLEDVTVTGTLTINGGEVTLKGTTDISNEVTSVTVNENGTLNIVGGNYGGVTGSGTGNITGGTFSTVSKALLAEGYVTEDIGNAKSYGTGAVTYTEAEAMLGTGASRVYYETLADAVDAAKAAVDGTENVPEVPVLVNNASYDLKEENSPLKVKLNGKTLTVDAGTGKYGQKSGPDEAGVTTYTIQPAVAYIEATDTTYASVVDAINAATDGQTIKLLDDVDNFAPSTENFAIISGERTIIIDLNNHVLTPAKQNITVCGGANVTFQNGTINIVNHTDGNQEYVFGVTGYNSTQGFLTFKNVNFTGSDIKVSCGVFAAYNNKASVLNIENCNINFTGLETDLLYGQTYATGSSANYINVTGTKITTSGIKSTLGYAGVITISNSEIEFKTNGGSYGTLHHTILTLDNTTVSMEPTDPEARVEGKWIGLNVTGDGTVVTLKNNSSIDVSGTEGVDGVKISGTASFVQDTTSKVTLNEEPIAVGVADINGTQYKTLAEAVSAVKAGETITLLSDAEIATTLTINKANVVLDGAGHTIKAVHGTPENTENDHFGYSRLLENGAVAPNNYGRSAGRNMISLEADGIVLKNVTVSSNGLYPRHLVNIPANVTATIANVTLDHSSTTGWGGNALHLNGNAVISGNLAVSLGERTWAAISFNQNDETLDLTNCTGINVISDTRTAPQAFILTGSLSGNAVVGLEEAGFAPVSGDSNRTGFEPVAGNAKIGSADAEGTVYNYKVGSAYFATFAAAAEKAAKTDDAVVEVFKTPTDTYTLQAGETLQVKLHDKVEDAKSIVKAAAGYTLEATTDEETGITTYSLVGAAYVLMVKGESGDYEKDSYYASFEEALENYETSGMYILVNADTSYELKLDSPLPLYVKVNSEVEGANFTVSAPEGYIETTKEFPNSGSTRYTLTPITYTIAFDGNGADEGTSTASVSATYDKDATLTGNDFTKTGYTFQGWAISEEDAAAGTVTYEDKATVKNLTAVNGETVTLYAVWNVNQYTITYMTRDHEDDTKFVTHATQTYDFGATVVAPENVAEDAVSAPTRTGYTFNGWSKLPDTMPAKNLTIYATWKLDAHTITFNLNDDEQYPATNSNTTSFNVTSDEIPLVDAARGTKYVFDGWYDNAELTGEKVTTIPAGSYEDVELWAKWLDAEAHLKDKAGTDYYGTIDEMVAKYNDPETADWWPEDQFVEVNRDGMTRELADGESLTLDVRKVSSFTTTPVNENGKKSDEPFTGGYYAAEPVANENGTTTYATAKYIAQVKVDTYSYTINPNGTESAGNLVSSTYTLYDTFAHAAEAALAVDTTHADKTYKAATVIMLANNNVDYTLENGTLVVDRTDSRFTSKVNTAPAGYRVEQDSNGNVYTFSLVETVNVTFDDLDDNTENVVKTIDKGEVVEAPDDPTRDGYTFAGWYNGEDKYEGTPVEEDITLTAHWTANDYSISYKGLNGGTNPNKDLKSYTPDSPDIKLEDASATGYVFQGWSVKIGDNKAVLVKSGDVAIPAGSFGAVTATAKWIRETYTVEFATGVDTWTVDSQSVEYQMKANEPAGAPDRSSEGYELNGWYTKGVDEEGKETKVTFDFSEDTITENTTLYADWQPISYSINYVLRNGEFEEGKENPRTYTVEDTFKLNNPVRENWHFRGWTIPALGISTPNDDVTISAGTKGNLNIGARWAYNVNFISEGVEYVEAQNGILQGSKVTKPETDPTKTGYVFDGWFTAKEDAETHELVYADEAFNFDEAPTVGDLTLYAKFHIGSFTLTVDPNGGKTFSGSTSPVVLTRDYGETIGEIKDASKDGYVFDGWYDDPVGGNKVGIPETMGAENVTVYAHYSIQTYKLVIDFAGGTFNGQTKIEKDYEYGAAIEEKLADMQPTLENFTFKEWSAEIPATMPAADVTITAIWDGIQRSITFMDETTNTVFQSGKQTSGNNTEIPDVEDILNLKRAGYGLDVEDLWSPAVDEVVSVNRIYKLKWKPIYTVDFVVNGAVIKSVEDIMEGKTIDATNEPSAKKNGEQAKWLVDGVEGQYFSFGEEGTKVTGNWTLVATWDEEPVVKTYTVKFVNADGTELQSSEVAEGETPVYSGEIPTKAEDDEFTYSFAGWTPVITAASADAAYTATFTATAKEPVAHEHSWVYSAIDWDYSEYDDGVYGAYITYVCDCGEEEEEFVAASSSVSKGVRTYTVTDKFGDTHTETIELTYTVIFNGVKQSIDYKWGQVCLLSSDDGEAKLWKANGQTVADGVNSYSFAVNSNIEITTEATENTAPVAAVAATLVSESTGTAEFNAMWSIPGNATVNKVTIYRGSSSVDKTVDADTLMSKGSKVDVNLLVRNGSFCLKLSDLTSGKYQHVVIVIDYTDANGAQQLVSAVQKIQIK